MSVRSARSLVRTVKPFACMCSTHFEQHPHVGVLNTSTIGPAAFCWAAMARDANAAMAIAPTVARYITLASADQYDTGKSMRVVVNLRAVRRAVDLDRGVPDPEPLDEQLFRGLEDSGGVGLL